MTWWQIVLILISWVIVWTMGSFHGYDTGWNAHAECLRQDRLPQEESSDNG